jgi:hypothetical protein
MHENTSSIRLILQKIAVRSAIDCDPPDLGIGIAFQKV